MSVGYTISEADLSDIKGWISKIDRPDLIDTFKIWPANVQDKIGLYISIERKPFEEPAFSIPRDDVDDPRGDTVFTSFQTAEERKAFIGRLAAAFAVEQVSFKIDYEVGEKMMQFWAEIQARKAAGLQNGIR